MDGQRGSLGAYWQFLSLTDYFQDLRVIRISKDIVLKQ